MSQELSDLMENEFLDPDEGHHNLWGESQKGFEGAVPDSIRL